MDIRRNLKIKDRSSLSIEQFNGGGFLLKKWFVSGIMIFEDLCIARF